MTFKAINILLQLSLLFVMLSAIASSEVDNAAVSQTAQLTNNPSNSISDFLKLLTPEEIHYLSREPKVVVCNISQAAGSRASLDIVKVIADKTGLTIQASPSYAWQQGLDGLQKGSCDILPWATETQQRKRHMNFTPPYTRIMRILITKQQQPYIANIADFGEKIFATEKDNQIVSQLKRAFPKMQTVRTNHTKDALNLVLDGKVFASIASIYSVANLFTTEEYANLKIAGRLPESFDDIVSLATRKEDKILNRILTKALQATDAKEIRDFMNKGAIFGHQKKIDYRKIWIISSLTLIVLVALVFWNRRLTTLNNQLEQAKLALQIKSKELELLSITDPLTKAFNRLKIDKVFAQEIERSERYDQPLSIIMIDIDHFKKVNDDFGHLVGDQVLSTFTLLLTKNLRSSDLLGRWGGEEFLAICPSTTEGEAEQVAEKLRMTLESAAFPYVEQITASFGVAQRITDDTQEMLTSKADRALYQAKNNGRNKVCIASEKIS